MSDRLQQALIEGSRDDASAALGAYMNGVFHQDQHSPSTWTAVAPLVNAQSDIAYPALGNKFLFFAWTPETGREPFTWEPDPPVPETPQRGCGCSSAGGFGLLALALALLATRRRRC